MEIKVIIKKSSKNGRYYAIANNGFSQKFLDLELALMLVSASYSDINDDETVFVISSKKQ